MISELHPHGAIGPLGHAPPTWCLEAATTLQHSLGPRHDLDLRGGSKRGPGLFVKCCFPRLGPLRFCIWWLFRTVYVWYLITGPLYTMWFPVLDQAFVVIKKTGTLRPEREKPGGFDIFGQFGHRHVSNHTARLWFWDPGVGREFVAERSIFWWLNRVESSPNPSALSKQKDAKIRENKEKTRYEALTGLSDNGVAPTSHDPSPHSSSKFGYKPDCQTHTADPHVANWYSSPSRFKRFDSLQSSSVEVPLWKPKKSNSV